MTKQHLGVTALFLGPSGQTVAVCSDFGEECYPTKDLRTSQEIRAKRGLVYKIINSNCGGIAKFITDEMALAILGKMMDNKELTMIVVPIEYEIDAGAGTFTVNIGSNKDT